MTAQASPPAPEEPPEPSAQGEHATDASARRDALMAKVREANKWSRAWRAARRAKPRW